MTAQGHPRRIFATAIERGNIVMAEATARELGRVSLEEALELVLLYAAALSTPIFYLGPTAPSSPERSARGSGSDD